MTKYSNEIKQHNQCVRINDAYITYIYLKKIQSYTHENMYKYSFKFNGSVIRCSVVEQSVSHSVSYEVYSSIFNFFAAFKVYVVINLMNELINSSTHTLKKQYQVHNSVAILRFLWIIIT